MSSQPGKPAKLEDPKAVLNRELWAVLTPGIILTLIGFLLAFTFVGAPPPKTLRFASGSSWGAYNRYAQMYKQELAKEGLNVQVLETKGSTENLRLLVEGKADIAFVQGGIVPPSADVELVSLGSVYFEPLWLFIRSDVPQSRFSQLEGKRIAIGPEGSGTRAVALELLEDAEVIDQVMTVDAGGEAAEQMLYEGEVDAVFMIGSPTIDAVRRMLGREGVQLMQFERSKALERRHQFLSRIPLYAGVVDLKGNIPPEDIELLAPAATLVVRKNFHKALPPVILAAATEIHGRGSILSDHGAFPSPLYCSYPIAREARYYYDRGLSFLYRHLPFYLASGLDRLAILLLPFVGLMDPIIRLLPPVYNWTMKRKIYRQYRNLQRLEHKFGLVPYEELVEELNAIETAAKKLASMPPAYGADIYALRSNLERVRDRIAIMESGPPKLTLRKADKSLHRKPGKGGAKKRGDSGELDDDGEAGDGDESEVED